MELLKKEFDKDLKIEDYLKLMDEYFYDIKKIISYKGIIVGSDIVDYNFVKQNILTVNAQPKSVSL